MHVLLAAVGVVLINDGRVTVVVICQVAFVHIGETIGRRVVGVGVRFVKVNVR